MTTKIGYQGLEGSFSEMAARQIVKDCGLDDASFIPLVTAHDVIFNLHHHTIDYGLVATRNSIGGNVEETVQVLKNTQLQLKRAAVYSIHQCLFKRDAQVKDEDITKIVSHVQALRQTEQFRKKKFPHAQAIEEEDTAQAAYRLANGDLDSTCAVICSYEAGKRHGLYLCERNIEDTKDNRTEFRLFCLPDPKLVSIEGLDDALTRDALFTEYLGKGIIILILALALWGLTIIDGTPFGKISALAGYLLLVYILYKKGQDFFNTRALKGYWKYYSAPENNKDDSQQYHVPRVVKIIHLDGHFRLTIYNNIGGLGKISVIGEPAYSFKTGGSRGKFTYEYHSFHRKGALVSGFAILNWYKKHPWSIVKKMDGDYFGVSTREIGSFVYYRISKEEFDDISQSQFLAD